MRLEQINETILRALGEILSKELEFDLSIFITVLGVETSPDREKSRIEISVFPDAKRFKVLRDLQKRAPFLRSIMAKKVRGRRVPELIFVLPNQTPAN